MSRLRTSAYHPDLRSISRFLPKGAVGPRTLGLVRRGSARRGRGDVPGVTVEQVSDTASVRLHHPEDRRHDGAALLWIHGGGMVIGTAQQDDPVCKEFANALGVTVAAVEYRLAPEHPFPAPLDDCLAALEWLAAQPGAHLGRIAIGGASAGGGLAAGLALRARDQSAVKPIFQLLVYPMLDDRTAAKPDPAATHRRLWSNPANAFGWRSYLAAEPGSDGVSPYAAPARATDLAGLAPAWIGVGTLDLFHDEDLAYCDALRAAGVPCDLDVVNGAFHGFDLVKRGTPVSQAFVQSQISALRAAFDAAD